MEHLDMLITRSAIEDNKQLLDEEQQKRLFVADSTLIRQSEYFSAAIERIGDLNQNGGNIMMFR